MIPQLVQSALDLGIAQSPIEFAEAIGLAGAICAFAYFVFKIVYEYVK